MAFLSIVAGIIIILFFYNLSSNFKNVYLELKNKFSADDKYLAVVTKNGLWIKDKFEGNINIINASKINEKFLINTFITQFDGDYNLIKNIYSEKIDIQNKKWIAYNVKIIEQNMSTENKEIIIGSNFDYKKIQSLFSNLSSLSVFELWNLKKNYETLNYSTTEVELQLYKLISYPFYLTLMTILSSIIMFNARRFKSSTLKVSMGLFSSVLIYYLNNFFMVMGKTEKIALVPSIFIPLLILLAINSVFIYKINEK